MRLEARQNWIAKDINNRTGYHSGSDQKRSKKSFQAGKQESEGDWSLRQGFNLVLQGQLETENGSLIRTGNCCTDREEATHPERTFSAATDCFCDPDISYWSRVNQESIKKRFNKVTEFFSFISPVQLTTHIHYQSIKPTLKVIKVKSKYTSNQNMELN